jgi:cysteine-S-conjugate beta-lyase
MKKDTLITKLGRAPEEHCGVVNPPVYRASTILFPTMDDFEGSENGTYPLIYGRSGTPSTRSLEAALAQIDGDDHAILTSSGLAAIVTALTGVLSAGDHMLAPDCIYGSMRKFCDYELKRFGVEITYYDPLIGGGVAALMKPNTKLVYCESPGSLTFEVQDLPAIARAAHKGGALVAADNTWATPLFLRARDFGVDITIHSCTKYIGGHSDLVMGLITTSKELYPQLQRVYRNLGCCPGSEEVYLAQRGLRTMATRLKQHEEVGMMLAHWFKKRPEVVKILHPAFPECPGHAVWKRDFTGATGLFSVLLKPYPHKALAAMLDHMELFGMGFSWGGYESLMIPFKPHRTVSPGWTHKGACLRVHAGLENPDDLIADLEAGFDRLNKAA